MSHDIPPDGVAPVVISDRARRAHDAVMLHLTALGWDGVKNGWIAVRLSDGSSDGVLYESKRDAVRHQHHEQQCAYIAYRGLGPSGSRPGEIERYLAFMEKAYDAGFRLADPDDPTGGPDIAPTAARMDDFRTRLLPKIHAENLRQQASGLGIYLPGWN